MEALFDTRSGSSFILRKFDPASVRPGCDSIEATGETLIQPIKAAKPPALAQHCNGTVKSRMLQAK